jgi:hypothetical protein
VDRRIGRLARDGEGNDAPGKRKGRPVIEGELGCYSDPEMRKDQREGVSTIGAFHFKPPSTPLGLTARTHRLSIWSPFSTSL